MKARTRCLGCQIMTKTPRQCGPLSLCLSCAKALIKNTEQILGSTDYINFFLSDRFRHYHKNNDSYCHRKWCSWCNGYYWKDSL